MKHYLLIATIVLLVSCNDDVVEKQTKNKEVYNAVNALGSSTSLSEKQRLLLKLMGLRLRAINAKQERYEMEILYLRTGKDKYRRIGNKSEELRVDLNKQMMAVSDTLDSLN